MRRVLIIFLLICLSVFGLFGCTAVRSEIMNKLDINRDISREIAKDYELSTMGGGAVICYKPNTDNEKNLLFKNIISYCRREEEGYVYLCEQDQDRRSFCWVLETDSQNVRRVSYQELTENTSVQKKDWIPFGVDSKKCTAAIDALYSGIPQIPAGKENPSVEENEIFLRENVFLKKEKKGVITLYKKENKMISGITAGDELHNCLGYSYSEKYNYLFFCCLEEEVSVSLFWVCDLDSGNLLLANFHDFEMDTVEIIEWIPVFGNGERLKEALLLESGC